MSKEVMQQALEALETERENYQDWDKQDGAPEYIYEAITALREELAKPDFWEGYVPEPVKPAQQEPVAWMTNEVTTGTQVWLYEKTAQRYQNPPTPLYTSLPAQRTWEEWFKWWRTSKVADSTEAEIDFADFMLIVRAVEAEYGIKENT